MEPKTGLLIWWILTMILAMTCRPTDGKCDVIPRIHGTRSEMNKLLNKFHFKNGNSTRTWPEPISELDFKNLTDKENLTDKAQCGLHYMKKAVELIRKHQHDLHGHVIHIPDHIIEVLELTRKCVEHAIGHCKNKKEPDFSYPQTYERKQWGGTVLKISVDFLDELEKVVKHIEQTKTTPYKSIKSKNHQINTA